MSIENRQKLLGIVALAVFGVWAADALLITPLSRAWSDRSARVARLRKSLQDGRMTLDRERAIRERWESMRTNTLPSESSEAEAQLLKAFDRWADDSRISITSTKPGSKAIDDQYLSLDCRADGSGNMQAITRFLYNIEKDPMAVRIESVELTSRDNDGQQISLGLQVSGLRLNPQ